jgi:hypothetical protein
VVLGGSSVVGSFVFSLVEGTSVKVFCLEAISPV